jgi:hypothetical protein
MAIRKRTIEGSLTVDGQELSWNLEREQCWTTDDGWKGISIHVVLVAQGTHRTLILDYPAVSTKNRGYVLTGDGRTKIVPAKLELHIRQAMEAGWDPVSRGKPYIFPVEEQPS